MGYMDDQDGKDYTETEQKKIQKKSKNSEIINPEPEKPKKPAKGLFSRLRDALTGEGDRIKNGVKSGHQKWKSEGGMMSGAKSVLVKIANPKTLAMLATLSGTGFLSIFGLFSSYKNDDIIRNDPPLKCETVYVALPTGGDAENDIQENVNIMYDIFCNRFGYSEEFLVGLVSCMMVESSADPTRLESDYLPAMKGAKDQFLSVAGPGKPTSSSVAMSAFDTYANMFRTNGGWNGNTAYMANGKMTCGIGLIQWTGGRAHNLINGLDVVKKDYSVTDLAYQCAFLLAEFKTSYSSLAPEGDWAGQCGSDEAATKYIFQTLVSGGSLSNVGKRTAFNTEVRGYVNTAAANSKFTNDVVTMAELLADDSFNAGVGNTQQSQLCVNGTVIDPTSIAMAAVSLSWLERGEYANEEGAYNTERRAARSPIIVNDWDYVEGFDNKEAGGTPESHNVGTENVSASACGAGKHDLIACTEFYYYAHLIAFPKETGKAGQAGYFSSCDRGTATAVRIAGADDKFPAGNPDNQLSYMLGKEHNAIDNKLWEPSGFLRGCDYYSFAASSSISPGTIMVSWENKAANGMLAEGGNLVDSSDPAEYEDMESGEMAIANLRFPLSDDSTHNHIITYVGEGTVSSYWGMDFLYQQYRMFDDADSLIRGDLTIEAPEDMSTGLGIKAQTASKSSDQETTFYMEQNEGAKNHEDIQTSDITDRDTEFNAKTGLPEFKSWEEIFVRLIHNSDDDAAKGNHGGAEGDDLYIEFETDEDNYLDSEEDEIEQFGGENSNSNKFFYGDWNGVGAGDIKGGGDGDYEDVDPDELLWWDDGSDEWTNTWNYGTYNGYWRYEYITDVEYRLNQFMRFGMASMMCSYASEEDAAIYQGGDKDGHIFGNVYRRMSRISDDVDKSNRYFYYNTVVSNDMLQDLIQLYSFEGNDVDGEKDDDNFGPIYNLAADYPSAKSKTPTWGDRRYGLTAKDIEEIMNGVGGYTMGSDTGEGTGSEGTEAGANINSYLHDAIYKPMYELSEAELALYDRNRNADSITDGRGAHEGMHTFIPESFEQEIYGMNPFLMIDGYLENDLVDMTENPDDYRSDQVTGDETDARLAFVDRHFWADYYGNINMYAYAVLGMNPSNGKKTTESAYENAIDQHKTLDAAPVNGATRADSDTLGSSYGVLRYTDYIYGESTTDNEYMAKRLYGDDDRDDDGDRDDYNRREYIVVPYYHTHEQRCEHDPKLNDIGYDLTCEWYDDDPTCGDPDTYKLDSQVYQNEHCNDYLTTISFDTPDNRGKYSNIQGLPAYGSVHYYLEDGTEITEEKPPIHVTCGGYSCTLGPCQFPGCSTVVLPGGTPCTHDCEECMANGFEHDHDECDGGDECHDKYGCNAMEYYYHNDTKVYMVLQVVDKPKEIWGTDIDIADFMKGGKILPDKANLLQQIQYQNWTGFVKDDYVDSMNELATARTCTSSLNHATSGKPTYEIGIPVGFNESLIGYFTIEGNVIQRDPIDGETISTSKPCVSEDLQRVESIRNRVGVGKIAGHVTQSNLSVTGLEEIKYDKTSRDNGMTPNGYGEIMVVGAQHKVPPTKDMGNYGDPSAGSGPDTKDGNNELEFGKSLLWEILGDNHVFHIRFGSQDESAFEEYDFQYYEEFIDLDEDKKYRDNYTFEVTTSEKDKFEDPNKELNDYHANGDYGHWVSHASRGDRGMKTGYLIFKSFFGDALDGTLDSSNMQYMLFSNVQAKDERDVDHDGDVDESFIYNSPPGDATNTDTGIVYGQGGNSHWRHLIELYNAAMSESRQFD